MTTKKYNSVMERIEDNYLLKKNICTFIDLLNAVDTKKGGF